MDMKRTLFVIFPLVLVLVGWFVGSLVWSIVPVLVVLLCGLAGVFLSMYGVSQFGVGIFILAPNLALSLFLALCGTYCMFLLSKYHLIIILIILLFMVLS